MLIKLKEDTDELEDEFAYFDFKKNKAERPKLLKILYKALQTLPPTRYYFI